MIPIPKRLLAFKSVIVAINPDNQAIQYDASKWTAYFPADPDMLNLTTMFSGQITRGNIKVLSARAVTNSALIRKLFLATMIWGFGERGFGPWRTCRMLDTTSSASILQKMVTSIQSGAIYNAYENLRLDRCGPVFLTKLLYFVGLGVGSNPLPLVLDARVAESLDLLGINLKSLGCRKSENGIAVERSPAGYVQYIQMINEWANQIGCRPDAIELFLFAPPQAFVSWTCSSGEC